MTTWIQREPHRRQAQIRYSLGQLTCLLKEGAEGELKTVVARGAGATVEEAMAHALNDVMAKQGEPK